MAVTMPMELVSKQLALSGRLKPEARLGLAISEFAQVLDSERRKEFRSMQNTQGAQISGREIIKMTEEINQEGARRHRSWRPHGTKVGGFLTRIQNFATIGDVLVGGSQNLIATGVWSAVRLSLTIATNYLSYFEKLSTLFMRLGTSWTLHKDFARLFPASEVLQAYFCEYLISLMKLCNKAVVFCQKNVRAQLLSSLGSSFDSAFGPVQKELDQWGCLIEQQTHILATKMATNAENGRFQGLKQRLLQWLSPYQSDYETRWRRQRKKGTCKWIFDDPSFKDWKSMQASATLSVHGKLGSGKTVSMANMVARINIDQPCAYVFCATQEPSSLKAANILGSLAFSMLENVPSEATAQIRGLLDDTTKAFGPKTIIDFLLRLLPQDRKYIIIADGLENCSDEEIDDVIFGLQRLMQNRLVLVCYASRSDSQFQHTITRDLPPAFSISLDDTNHDAELEAFIMEEVTRRNATRHLSPELEELVRKQLTYWAQGMYLWVSLQLDTIFPTTSKVVITDEQIKKIVAHLPKDLPEAFEQALERIPDRQYEGKIMKLVMAAETPLGLDEVRVALCIVVGETVWHPEKIAKDGTQLISLCGGNLLELDEEDEKVRFIHHSVISHLRLPAARQTTIPYHFTFEDAQNLIGAICVTYLNLPILDSRITVAKNIHGQEVLDNVVESTRQSLPGINLLIEHIKRWRHKRARPSEFDIGHFISQVQAARVQEDLDPLCLAYYATNHWLSHTRFFDDKVQDCKNSWRLWWRLLDGGVEAVKLPWGELKSFTTLLWAVENAHASLFGNLVADCRLTERQTDEIVRTLGLRKTIDGPWLGEWLGGALSQYLLGLDGIDMPSTAERITSFLNLAYSAKPHSMWMSEPVEIFTNWISSATIPDDDKTGLVRTISAHPAVENYTGDKAVLGTLKWLLMDTKHTPGFAVRKALRELDRAGQNKPGKAFAIQKTIDVDLGYSNLPPPELPPLKLPSPKSAIEEALDRQKWEDVAALAAQGHINTPTVSGTSLLWTAIETMADSWVYFLLRLGADPTAGPFTMRKHVAIPGVVLKCFPIEAALWLRRTRVCVDLLRGANFEWNLHSPMQIAKDTGNWIVIARLREILGTLGPQTQHGQHRCNENDRTALVTACQMLSHPGDTEPFGFPRPALNYCTWISELEAIIHQLAVDGDAGYVNVQDADGKTALHYLSEGLNIGPKMFANLVDALLSRGADPNLADRHGDTPLWSAILNSTPIEAMVMPLLEAGANPNKARPLHNCSILEEALCAYQSTQEDVMRLMKLLIQAGADPRNHLTLASPDPSLISLASARGMESLIVDFNEYGRQWKAPGTPVRMI